MAEFSSAVRDFNYYWKYWQPQLDDELYCQHEPDNPFNFFAIEICIKTQVLQLAICQCRFLEQRSFYLTKKRQLSLNCLQQIIVSSLVQGGLEIPCCVEIIMPPILKNRDITDLYKSMIDLSNHNREKDLWLDRSFWQTKRSSVLLQHVVLQQAKRRK